MEVKIIDDIDKLFAIKNSWEELFYLINSNDLYQHPNWHISWWKSFGNNKKMFLVCLFINEKLVGVLPLAIYRGGLKDLGLKILGFSGGVQSDRNNIILHPTYLNKGIGFFRNEIEKKLCEVDIVYLHSIPIESKILDINFLKNKTYYSKDYKLPYIELSNTNYDEIKTNWKGSHRGDINRQIRRLDDLGKLTFDLCDLNSDLDTTIENFLKMHAIRWKKGYGKKYDEIKSFYTNLIHFFKNEKIIHFSTLKIGDVIISYHFGFIINHHFYYYKPAYNIDYRNLSPGKIHISKLIELSINFKCKKFDFLLGDEKYKYNWTSKEKHSRSYFIKGNSIVSNIGIWWFKYGKEIIRNLFSK